MAGSAVFSDAETTRSSLSRSGPTFTAGAGNGTDGQVRAGTQEERAEGAGSSG